MITTATWLGRERQHRGRPRLLAASVVVAAPGWIGWYVGGRHGSPVSAVVTSVVLAANFVVTRRWPAVKRQIVRTVQRYLINPCVRTLLWLGVVPLGYALLETTGRVSGRPRRTPVGSGRVGDTFWIVAEHGRAADYVRNLERDPRVRVKTRAGVRLVWREGVAHVVEHDDPYARQRALSRWHPLRALNAAVVRVMGTDLMTIRIDLTPPLHPDLRATT
jgi:deazaflavin-dependent oxidoreductase (nitroreductase family)